MAQLASDEEGTFGKAYLKYTDAVSFAPDQYLYHLHVGRFLLLQGKHDEAVKRLQFAVGLKPVNVQSRLVCQCVCQHLQSIMRKHPILLFLTAGFTWDWLYCNKRTRVENTKLLNTSTRDLNTFFTNLPCKQNLFQTILHINFTPVNCFTSPAFNV